MFEEPTTFILGAGASWHYNYPTGEGLVKKTIDKALELIRLLKRQENSVEGVSFYTSIQMEDAPLFFQKIIKESNADKELPPYQQYTVLRDAHRAEIVKRFQEFLEKIEHVNPPVIDHFLGWNDDFKEIGQFLIAWVILECEQGYEKTHRNLNHDPKDEKAHKDDWYRFILYKIVSGCKTASDLIEKNNVTFITFNYDVSLERYLYKGLRSIQFLNKEAGCVDDFMKDRFVHVYGAVREYPSKSAFTEITPPSNPRSISDYKDYFDTIYQASQRIKTIEAVNTGNKDDYTEEQKKAHAILDAAKRVYILGYGFDETNSGRLKLNEMLSEQAITAKKATRPDIKKEVYFTNFGDKNSVNKKAALLLTGNIEKFLPNQPAIYKGPISKHVDKDGRGHHVFFEKSTKNVYDALAEDFEFL